MDEEDDDKLYTGSCWDTLHTSGPQGNPVARNVTLGVYMRTVDLDL